MLIQMKVSKGDQNYIMIWIEYFQINDILYHLFTNYNLLSVILHLFFI